MKSVKNCLNTEIEPHHGNSKKLNVDKVTGLEPFDNGIVSENKSVGNYVYAGLISIMKESTFEYYNMRMALGLECD